MGYRSDSIARPREMGPLRLWSRPRKSLSSYPEGPERHLIRRDKIAARQVLPLNCRVIALTTGTILKEEKNLDVKCEMKSPHLVDSS